MTEGFYRLVQAICDGNESAVVESIASGADVNERDDEGQSPLFFSIATSRRRNQMKICRMLIEAGANTELSGPNGHSALHVAAAFGDPSILEALIVMLGDVDLRIGIDACWTPLMVAARYGRIDNAKVLLQHGADVNTVDFIGRSAADIALKAKHYRLARLLSHTKRNGTTS
ncbi:MAG: ankyrin repeat domain-containing protein [Gemmataceae bacterium]|nr:ankyrin repeat domain-containing protein [Gemmataceae bacterium]